MDAHYPRRDDVGEVALKEVQLAIAMKGGKGAGAGAGGRPVKLMLLVPPREGDVEEAAMQDAHMSRAGIGV